MPRTAGDISLEHDTPELARSYDEAGLVQFRHGKFLIGPLATLREIRRVLRPGGRLGLNVQDPSRPHQSRQLLRRAIIEAGLAGDRQDSNPVLGSTDEELKSQFAAHGFAGYRSELRALIDIHDDAASLLQWSEASAFGNFLEAFTPHERERVRRTFARLVEEKRTPEGLKLERYLRFAFAHKAPFHQ
ncbi:hypothetical protein RX327_09765 [Bradyrhizobium sp. BEA-2-5]|uniref:hypothetical protein n=1 Tax=Bradyrhizobium TaxID=374 RepID=UPI00067B9E68|nr:MULTISPECIES: hypothetical protein [Bradyrhizobium]WOH83394.1 hypothetical protein RX327_09765 [Bradyrhizobium sp. BEA-2-5]